MIEQVADRGLKIELMLSKSLNSRLKPIEIEKGLKKCHLKYKIS